MLADGNHFESDVEVARELSGIVDTALRRVWAGHANANDVLFAQSIDGDGGSKRRVDAAAQPQHDFAKSALVHVVACAQDECGSKRWLRCLPRASECLRREYRCRNRPCLPRRTRLAPAVLRRDQGQSWNRQKQGCRCRQPGSPWRPERGSAERSRRACRDEVRACRG